MAFNLGNTAQNVTPVGERRPSDYGNIYLPRNDGTRKKLGAIAMFADKSEDMELKELLATPEGREKVLRAMIIEVNSAVGGNESGLAV